MGVKGTSVNITNTSALFMSLVKTISEIETKSKSITASAKQIEEGCNYLEVDDSTKDSISACVEEVRGTFSVVSNQLTGVNKALNKIIETSNDIAARASASGAAVSSGIKQTRSKLGGRS